MPARVTYKKADPNGLGRGKGLYYKRSTYNVKTGKQPRGAYHSKYEPDRDFKKKSKGWQVHRIGLPPGTVIPHTSDGRLPR